MRSTLLMIMVTFVTLCLAGIREAGARKTGWSPARRKLHMEQSLLLVGDGRASGAGERQRLAALEPCFRAPSREIGPREIEGVEVGA